MTNEIQTNERIGTVEIFSPNWGKLNNWANERTLLTDGSSPISKLKEEFKLIGAERNARRSIVLAMAVDNLADNLGFPYIYYPGGIGNFTMPTYEKFGVFGNPADSEGPIIDKIGTILTSKGFDQGMGEITVQKTDSVTGEPVMVTVGIADESGIKTYYGEEKDANGNLISRAVILGIGSNQDRFGGMFGRPYSNYRLELHFSGGRYAENNAELDINTSTLPRATIKTLDLLTGAVIQGLEE